MKQVIVQDKTSKVAYRKLGLSYDRAGLYDNASTAYEELHALDPRDHKVAIQVSDVNIAAGKYGKAMRWAEKAITSSKSGEAYGQRGNVYYKAFQECRSVDISIDDRIIAIPPVPNTLLKFTAWVWHRATPLKSDHRFTYAFKYCRKDN